MENPDPYETLIKQSLELERESQRNHQELLDEALTLLSMMLSFFGPDHPSIRVFLEHGERKHHIEGSRLAVILAARELVKKMGKEVVYQLEMHFPPDLQWLGKGVTQDLQIHIDLTE